MTMFPQTVISRSGVAAIRAAALMALACAGFPLIAAGQTYDLVINNGRVMDPETMYDDIANVGVKDGRIAAITKEKITGKENHRRHGHGCAQEVRRVLH